MNGWPPRLRQRDEAREADDRLHREREVDRKLVVREHRPRRLGDRAPRSRGSSPRRRRGRRATRTSRRASPRAPSTAPSSRGRAARGRTRAGLAPSAPRSRRRRRRTRRRRPCWKNFGIGALILDMLFDIRANVDIRRSGTGGARAARRRQPASRLASPAGVFGAGAGAAHRPLLPPLAVAGDLLRADRPWSRRAGDHRASTSRLAVGQKQFARKQGKWDLDARARHMPILGAALALAARLRRAPRGRRAGAQTLSATPLLFVAAHSHDRSRKSPGSSTSEGGRLQTLSALRDTPRGARPARRLIRRRERPVQHPDRSPFLARRPNRRGAACRATRPPRTSTARVSKLRLVARAELRGDRGSARTRSLGKPPTPTRSRAPETGRYEPEPCRRRRRRHPPHVLGRGVRATPPSRARAGASSTPSPPSSIPTRCAGLATTSCEPAAEAPPRLSSRAFASYEVRRVARIFRARWRVAIADARPSRHRLRVLAPPRYTPAALPAGPPRRRRTRGTTRTAPRRRRWAPAARRRSARPFGRLRSDGGLLAQVPVGLLTHSCRAARTRAAGGDGRAARADVRAARAPSSSRGGAALRLLRQTCTRTRGWANTEAARGLLLEQRP